MVKGAFGFESKPIKSKLEKPVLSEEQFANMQELIYESYNTKIKLDFEVFKAGDINIITGTVLIIRTDKKVLILENKREVAFNSIVGVKRFIKEN